MRNHSPADIDMDTSHFHLQVSNPCVLGINSHFCKETFQEYCLHMFAWGSFGSKQLNAEVKSVPQTQPPEGDIKHKLNCRQTNLDQIVCQRCRKQRGTVEADGTSIDPSYL